MWEEEMLCWSGATDLPLRCGRSASCEASQGEKTESRVGRTSGGEKR